MTAQFQLAVFQNEYLPEGAAEVNAIVTVSATGGAGGPSTAQAGPAAEVIIMDCSGSMEMPRRKLEEAKRATSVAIDTLRDGVQFAVVNGMDIAQMIYPRHPRMVTADDRTRAEAKSALAGVRADGGTAIGEWLLLADRLFADQPASIKHAILLTDGRNEHEAPQKLDTILRQVAGKYVVDCRGVGTDWEVAELRKISNRMLGSVDIIAEPAGLAADFRSMTAAAMGKEVADVALRLWTPQGATVKYVKQVEPSLLDLTDRRVESVPRSGDYPTASWGTESRDYHVCVQVSPPGRRPDAGRPGQPGPAGRRDPGESAGHRHLDG
ncbi:vWA domain-containing protein [Fodinicola feengrottensis]|uniref:vWA domain-containing protein n=1 Tax=Fodinicola feengrottensis TaxID=435914 RepID=UPI002442439A|nr:VWA domain-containing protein [Fodinicola feengrottensis]